VPIEQTTRRRIRQVLRTVVEEKLRAYDPETYHKPFHHRLFGDRRCAIFSFMHSMNTVLGMSVWKQISSLLARSGGRDAIMHHQLPGSIDQETGSLIERIHSDLVGEHRTPDCAGETELIRSSIQPSATTARHPDRRVGLVVKEGGLVHLLMMKTAKPNKDEFISFKLKLLRWKALALSQNRSAEIAATLVIPYNPYYPGPYDRWTRGTLFDEQGGELMVGPEFWNSLAGDDVYDDLLSVFQEVGATLQQDIESAFSGMR